MAKYNVGFMLQDDESSAEMKKGYSYTVDSFHDDEGEAFFAAIYKLSDEIGKENARKYKCAIIHKLEKGGIPFERIVEAVK